MFGKKKTLDLHAVFAGDVVAIGEVPDPVFAEKMLGDGFAVAPADDVTRLEVLSPVKGTVTKVFRTLHAVTFATEEGVDVLVHIGLETVELGGQGFEALVAKGDAVEPGTPIMAVDAMAVRAAGKNLITPVVLTDATNVSAVNVIKGTTEASAKVATAKLD